MRLSPMLCLLNYMESNNENGFCSHAVCVAGQLICHFLIAYQLRLKTQLNLLQISSFSFVFHYQFIHY